jgi:hypothetical protein
MKYVIFKYINGGMTQYMPVIFPEHVSHSQVKLEGCEVHSAGFVQLLLEQAEVPDLYIDKDSPSVSLGGIGPQEEDLDWLAAAFNSEGTMAFTKFAEAPADTYRPGKLHPSAYEEAEKVRQAQEALKQMAEDDGPSYEDGCDGVVPEDHDPKWEDSRDSASDPQ